MQYKDANEFFMTNRTEFEKWCERGFSAFKETLRESGSQAREEFENESAYSDLGNFVQTLKKSREGKSIPTGFSQFDSFWTADYIPGCISLAQ